MHLGTSMYMLGSILSMLVFQMLDGLPQTSLEQVWSEIVDYDTEHKVEPQLTNLELGMFRHEGNYPKMSGKGAEVKDLVPALHHVLTKSMTSVFPTTIFRGEILTAV